MHLYAIYGDHLHHWRILRHKKAYYFYSKSVHVLWINWNNKIFMVSHFFYHSWLTAINQKFYASIDILDLVVCVCMCVFVLVTRACKREITISGIDFCQDICTKNKQNVYKSVYIVIWTWLNKFNLHSWLLGTTLVAVGGQYLTVCMRVVGYLSHISPLVLTIIDGLLPSFIQNIFLYYGWSMYHS